MSEWFDERQSFAHGIMFGASGLFGSFIPTIYTKLLHSFGQQVALLVHGGGVLILTMGVLIWIDHRIPIRSDSTEDEKNISDPARSTVYDFWTKTSF